MSVSVRFNGRFTTQPESLEKVMKVLSQTEEFIVKDIARMSGITQTQAGSALEELVASGKVVVRKLKTPRKTLYRLA